MLSQLSGNILEQLKPVKPAVEPVDRAWCSSNYSVYWKTCCHDTVGIASLNNFTVSYGDEVSNQAIEGTYFLSL